jgi:hypothetical protein
MVACLAETYANIEKALVSFEHHYTQVQIQEWYRAMNTLMVTIPIVAIIIIVAIWWKPLNNQ